MEAKKFKENDVKIFAGSSAKKLAQKIADYVGLPLSKNKIQKFADGEIFTKSPETAAACRTGVARAPHARGRSSIFSNSDRTAPSASSRCSSLRCAGP